MTAKDTRTDNDKRWSSPVGEDHRTDFERTSTAGGRALSFLCWLGAIVLQVLAVLVASGKLVVPVLSDAPVVVVVVVAVACAALSLLGARSWRAADKQSGARKQGGVDVAMSCAAFAPMCLFFLSSKNAEAKTRAVAAACSVAMIAVLVALWMI